MSFHYNESNYDYYYYYLPDDCYEPSQDYPDQEDEPENSNYIYIVNTILSGTARLNLLLPTATILAFTIFAPLLTNEGHCSPLDRWLMGFFLTLLALTCVFFSLTDSFRTSTGRLYYGVATIHGIRTFGGGSRVRPCVLSDYKLRRSDLLHASLGLIAFLAFALMHGDVLSCYCLVLPRRFANVFPLVVGFVASLMFVVFPSRRRGIGYPFMMQSDASFHISISANPLP